MLKKLTLLLSMQLIICIMASAQSVPVSNDGYHLYGPNSTWGQYLQVGGNGQATNNAFVAVTNGNLHLDAKPGFATYINHYNQGNTLVNTQGGNVGIGTYAPMEKLDVQGNLRSDRLRVGNAIFKWNSKSSFNSFNSGSDNVLSNGWVAADFGGADNTTDRFVVGTGYGGRVVIGTHNYDLTSWGSDLLINPVGGGNVAIGTTVAREKLSVNGNIRAKEIKVEAANWPDYVFDRDYKVLGLNELERYIKVNKHLPDMPSAKDADVNGIELGEMNKLLLKKVEELTLHLIEKDKALAETQKKVIQLTEAQQKSALIETSIFKRLAEVEKALKQ